MRTFSFSRTQADAWQVVLVGSSRHQERNMSAFHARWNSHPSRRGHCQGTAEVGFSSAGTPLGSVLVVTDADWAGDAQGPFKQYRKSCVGQEQYDGNVVSCVRFAPETERSELMALVGGACEGIATRGQWIKMCGCASGTIVLRTDRSAALCYVKRKGASRQTRHVDTKIYFMQAWAIEPGQRILKVHGDCQQIEDCLTKITMPQAAHREAFWF